MAIDDNTSYELTGAQVKDLASKIKGNKTLTENLAGGEDIAYRTIFMMPITPERSIEIAEELGDVSLSPDTFMKYEFRMASTGEVIKSVGDLASWISDEGYNVVYKPVYSSKEQFVVTSIAADDLNYEWLEIDISRIVFPDNDGYAAHIANYNLYFSEDSTYWYSVTRTIGKAPNVSCYVKYIGKYANEIAAEINASVPAGEEVGPTQLWSTMRFVFINPGTGAYAKTLTAIRSLLRNSGTVIFLTDDAGHQDYTVTSASWTGSSATGHGTLSVFSPHQMEEYTYTITGPTEPSGSLSHIWYMLTIDETVRFLAWDDYFTIDPSTDVPNGAGEFGHDASNNMYIGVGSSSISDWKQINNDAITSTLATVATSGNYNDLTNQPTIPTVNNGTLTIQHNGTAKGTFTANQSSASTVNIETIYADTISPATAVDPITTSMIADGAVTAAKIDWSTIMTAILSTDTVTDGSWTGVKGLNYFKFDNGLMVVTGQTEIVQINANSHTDKSYNLTTSFTTYPIVVASISTDSGYNNMATVSNFYSTKSTIKLRFYNSDTGGSRSPIGTFIAIGMWK